MTAADLATTASILAAVSVASERLVEIIKGAVPYLEQKKDDPVAEGRRRALLHILALVAGTVSAFLAWDVLSGALPGEWVKQGSVLAPVGVGFLAAGGSSFWNSILGYANKLKELKKFQAEDLQTTVESRKGG